MKIKVEFTLEIAAKHLPALRELAEADSNAAAASFVRAEAAEYVMSYLEDGGAPVANAAEVHQQIAGASTYQF